MHAMQPHDTRFGASPCLWRIAAAAKFTGMAPGTFAAACRAGQIPVEVVEIGPRGFRYVRADQLMAWLRNSDLL
jgi:hypothetical protein